jgi:hypothetical protein
VTDYFDYPQDARDTRQPTSPHLRFLPEDTCPDCPHNIGLHSSENEVGCLSYNWQDEYRVTSCPCLRPGTSQADQ